MDLVANPSQIDALVSQHKALQVQLKAISQQFLSSCIAFQSGNDQPGCYHPGESPPSLFIAIHNR
jgi:hypothetical protein